MLRCCLALFFGGGVMSLTATLFGQPPAWLGKAPRFYTKHHSAQRAEANARYLAAIQAGARTAYEIAEATGRSLVSVNHWLARNNGLLVEPANDHKNGDHTRKEWRVINGR
jgi:hypothetical protein